MADASGVVRCPSCGTKNRLRQSADAVPRCGKCHALLPWIAPASAATFDDEVRAPVPVVVDFWAEWCGPCRMVEPVLERFATEHAGRMKLVKVDVDEERDLAQRFDAMSIPLLVTLRDGAEVSRIVGAPPPAELARRLEAALEPAAAPN